AQRRFAADKEALAAAAIAGALERLGAGAADLAICGGACGGDLLFAEAALERRARLELYIPFEEPTFLAKSVDFAGRDWRRRYVAVRARGALHVMPVERGPTPEGEGSYERNNLWMLEAAMRFGAGKVDFNALWDRAYVPVIEALGYEPVRADQDTGALIVNQMFERLYFADLVLADMTIPNGNVYYEVGIRHASKEKGCVLLAADWSRQLFDVTQMRTVRYPLAEGDITEATANGIAV